MRIRGSAFSRMQTVLRNKPTWRGTNRTPAASEQRNQVNRWQASPGPTRSPPPRLWWSPRWAEPRGRGAESCPSRGVSGRLKCRSWLRYRKRFRGYGGFWIWRSQRRLKAQWRPLMAAQMTQKIWRHPQQEERLAARQAWLRLAEFLFERHYYGDQQQQQSSSL